MSIDKAKYWKIVAALASVRLWLLNYLLPSNRVEKKPMATGAASIEEEVNEEIMTAMLAASAVQAHIELPAEEANQLFRECVSFYMNLPRRDESDCEEHDIVEILRAVKKLKENKK